MHTPKLTKSVLKALLIIRDKKPTRPGEFAYWMWEDYPRWNARTKCGNGVSIGGGMNIAAGGYLGKLKKAGWIDWQWSGNIGVYIRSYFLTDQAIRALSDQTLS